MFARRFRVAGTAKVVVFAGWLVGSGCNTDRVHRIRRAPEGPVVASPAEWKAVKAAQAETARSSDPVAEVDLVEAVLSHRALYHQNLERLRDHYRAHGYATKEGWAQFELEGLRKVKAFRYLDEAEVPPAPLKPSQAISDADALFNRAMELMKKGGHGVHIFYRRENMVEASKVFRELIEKYPSSDKVDESAFYLGEIHKEYLPGQEAIAVQWYERAWTWNPQTPHPARFQAAVTYDYRLHDRDKALELYRAVVQEETSILSNVRFAQRRIGELTELPRTPRSASR